MLMRFHTTIKLMGSARNLAVFLQKALLIRSIIKVIAVFDGAQICATRLTIGIIKKAV